METSEEVKLDELEELEVKEINDEIMEVDESSSEILKFYEGSTIFLTGCTGFLGRLMVEKILRTCSNISKIYLLVRPKRDKTPQERIDKMFNDIIFEKMRLKFPNYIEKVSLILGDCGEPDLGLSEEDKQTIIENVDIVFHVAATVKFNEIIRKATNINIRGTRDIVKLGTQIKKLKAFVHVSTAYSNCILPKIDEVFYDNVQMTADQLIGIVNSLDDEKLEIITPDIIGEWPNTYSYTKAIAENVVRNYGKNMPIIIVRPSIVISTCKEPIPGWTNNFFGPVGMALAFAIGILRTVRCNPNYRVDIVPADYCINSIITSAWVVGQKNITNEEVINSSNKSNSDNVVFDELKKEDYIPILNYVGSCQKPITNRQFKALCNLYGPEIPSKKCIWYYCSWIKLNKYKYFMYKLFLHYLPALFIDIGLCALGKQPIMLKAYKKIHKFCDVNNYFNVREWEFTNDNVQTIWKKLNATDKRLFEFDMNLLTWQNYAKDVAYGARVYLLRDPPETIPEGKRRHKKLKILHYTVITLFYLSLYYIVWWLDCSPFMLCGLVALYKFIM